MLIAIRDYDLCDGTNEGGVAATDFRLRVTRAIDVVMPLREVQPSTIDRGTRSADITFTVARNHATAKAAETYEATQERTIPQSGNIKVTSTNGAVIVYLINGRLLDHHLISQIGSTTFHSYHIVGGLYDVTPPTIGYILTETSDFVLTEIGDRILLE